MGESGRGSASAQAFLVRLEKQLSLTTGTRPYSVVVLQGKECQVPSGLPAQACCAVGEENKERDAG